MKTITTELLAGAIEVSWRVALESPTQLDWEYRWTGVREKLDGMSDLVIHLQLPNEDYEELADDLFFLWCITRKHHDNWEAA